MVYSASLYVLGSGNAEDGALMMLALGLGVAEPALVMRLFANQLKSLRQHLRFRLAAGLSVSLWAAWQLWQSSDLAAGWLKI